MLSKSRFWLFLPNTWDILMEKMMMLKYSYFAYGGGIYSVSSVLR